MEAHRFDGILCVSQYLKQIIYYVPVFIAFTVSEFFCTKPLFEKAKIDQMSVTWSACYISNWTPHGSKTTVALSI